MPLTSKLTRLADRLPGRLRNLGDPERQAANESQAGYVCHCKHVE
jgi:hypothetical protein